MRKVTIYIITVFLCIFIGFSGMYALIYFYPSAFVDKITREEKMLRLLILESQKA